jgi:hypothetical protein
MACDADCTQAANWKNHTTSFKGDMAKIGMTLAIAEDDVPALAISGHFSAGIATCTAACADATDWGTPRLITSPELVQSFPLQVPNCGGATWQQYAGSTIAFDAEKKPRIAFAAQIVTPLCGVAGYGGFLFLP